ncbi:hypothetical protein Taro_017704 [Colocasia esculenta]|uniref:Uncharacterized protein n=1 Tax=Colocasia esculenta TaxID=4460 RepID=A0A843UNU9_COLES|nr:hypothetical protein [Colocasia esculenta]
MLHRHQLGLPCRPAASLAREAPGEGRPTQLVSERTHRRRG